uniref:Fucosyltransferase n=1 Tax=Salmo trutta TaxID=8032 RepID=A0A673ZLU7_SALTR
SIPVLSTSAFIRNSKSFIQLLLYFSLRMGTTHQHQLRNLTILLWHWPFSRPYSLEGDICSNEYGIPGCLLSDNTSLYPQADVVVFHHHELRTGRSALPLHLPRPASQRWLWLSLEPPVNTATDPVQRTVQLDHELRADADVPMPMGRRWKFLFHQTAAAIWVVSNYSPDHARSQVYQSLRKYIPIEVYGRWLKRPLTDQSLIPTIGRCNFYLAFENSVAIDYITEKLWRNAYQAGAVPVVLGPSRSNYEALVPSGSFIHVSDFSSTEQLAAFLQQLATDRGRYEAYFKWRQTHEIKTYTDWRERLCNICIIYHRLPAKKVYYDLDGWANR